MPEIIQPGARYHTEFDPNAYFSTYYDPAKQDPEIYEFYCKTVFQNLHELVSMVPEGEKMIDIGSGPCIHGLACASGKFKKLYVSDFTENNRKAVVGWLSIAKNSIDWSPMLKFAAEVEGLRLGQLEARIRAKLRKVVPCDVTDPKVLSDENLAKPDFDLVQSMLCLEAARKDFDGYCESLGYISNNLVKPGGHVILSGLVNEDEYDVLDKKFHSVRLNRAMIEEAAKNGLVNEDEYDVLDKKFHSVRLNRAMIEEAAKKSGLSLLKWLQIEAGEENENDKNAVGVEPKGMFFVLMQKPVSTTV